MKKVFLFLTICFLGIQCSKRDNQFPEVDAFVVSLKESESETLLAPDFDVDDIPGLLKYRNDETKVSIFPRNPISSFFMKEVSVGMYVLWMVETTRLKAIDDPDFYLFASLNPRIAQKGSGDLIDQDAILPQVASRYFEWWHTNVSLNKRLRTAPLKRTDLIWN